MLLTVSLILSIIGCSSNEINPLSDLDGESLIESDKIFKVSDILVADREMQIKAGIDEVLAKFENMVREAREVNPMIAVKSSFPSIQDYPNLFLEFYLLGPASVPYILDIVDNSEHNGWFEAFLISAVTYNLNLRMTVGMRPYDSIDWDGNEVPYNADDCVYEGAFAPKWYAKQLREYAQNASSMVDEICDSDMTLEEKYERLDRMGMLAIPYLIDRINQGEEQWQFCLSAQLLDCPVEERFNALLELSELEGKNMLNDKSKFINSSSREVMEVNQADMEILRGAWYGILS